MKNLTKRQASAITSACTKANKWLVKYGLDADVKVTDDLMALGEYEYSSVFEKTIRITINPSEIKKACRDGWIKDDYNNVTKQTQVTIFHEMGHAILEQIIDWQENIETARRMADGEFGQRYECVFDDALPEEDLVEDFAWDFLYGRANPLKLCFEELSEALNKE